MRFKKNTILFAASMLLIILISLTTALQFWILDIKTPPPQLIDLKEPDKPVVYFGVISRYSPRQIYQGYQPFMDYLSANTPYQFELRLSHSYQETVEQLVRGEVDFASLGNYVYVKANAEQDIRCIAKPYYGTGETYFKEVVIAPEGSMIHGITDLAGHSFAFASRESFSFWMTQYVFHEFGLALDSLSRWENHEHHEIVVEKVLKGEFDAGMVKDIVARKYLSRGLRVVYESEPIPGVPLVVSPHATAESVALLLKVLDQMKEDIDSGKLDTSGWDEEVANGLAPAVDEDYDVTRNVLKAIGNLTE